jgi:hypothetical protein
VGPRAGLDGFEKRKIVHCQESNPDHPDSSPSLYHRSYHKIFLMTDISKPLQKETYTVSANTFKTEGLTSRLNGYQSRLVLRRSSIQNSTSGYPDMDFPCFSSVLQDRRMLKYLKSGHSCFLPHTFPYLLINYPII